MEVVYQLSDAGWVNVSDDEIHIGARYRVEAQTMRDGSWIEWTGPRSWDELLPLLNPYREHRQEMTYKGYHREFRIPVLTRTRYVLEYWCT